MTRTFIPITIVLFFIPFPSFAADVAAIKSMDIIPYGEAVKGFKSAVKAEVSEYTLDAEGDSGIIIKIKNKKTELVFTLGTSALNLVKDEPKDTPVIFTFVLNPDAVIGRGRGRTNITGIDMHIPPEEQFRIFLQVMPKAKRVGVVYDPAKNQGTIDAAKNAAQNLGITLIAKAVTSGKEAINAISDMEGKIDVLWMVPDTTVITKESIEYMLLFSFRNRIPLIGISDKYVKSGALFAVSFDNEDMGRQAGEIAMRVLEGEDIKSMSMLKPRRLRLSINLNTAEKIGLNIPEDIIRRADYVYK